MKIDVTTQTGEKYRVELKDTWDGILLERDLNLTYTEIMEAIERGSLDVTLQVIYALAKDQGKTQLKTFKTWVKTEYENFDYEADDPKALTGEASNTES